MKKNRIVLNIDNNNANYLFIGKQANNMGVYLMASMITNDAQKTPIIYNIQLRIKVDINE